MLKAAIVLLMAGLVASLGSGFYFLMVDQGDKKKRRTFNSLGVRLALAVGLMTLIIYGVATGQHAAPLTAGSPGVLHGNRTYLMQDANGQIMHTHSVSAGLDYPGVGPEHAWLKDIGRVKYVVADDQEALRAFHTLTRVEGIMPALESSHALAYAEKLAADMAVDQTIVVNLSGRGDKDIHTVAQIDGIEL